MCRAVDNLELLLSQPDESVDLIYCDILYGTGVGTYGGYTDLSRGGDIITVHNSETIFINQPKENVHHLAKGPK